MLKGIWGSLTPLEIARRRCSARRAFAAARERMAEPHLVEAYNFDEETGPTGGRLDGRSTWAPESRAAHRAVRELFAREMARGAEFNLLHRDEGHVSDKQWKELLAFYRFVSPR